MEKASANDYVGGLDRRQRALIMERVAEEFGWTSLLDVPTATRLTDDDMQSLVDEKLAISFIVDGLRQFPNFTFVDGMINPAIAHAVHELDHVLSDWEKLMWLCSPNGYLGGRRPADVTLDEIKIAVQAELDYATD